MNKEEFRRWFITTPPDGKDDDICESFPDNHGNPMFLCGSPDGCIILSGIELNEMYEARKKSWQKVVKE